MKLARIALALGTILLMTAAVACSSGTSSGDKTATAAAKGGAAQPTAAATKAATSSTPNATPAATGAQKKVTITAKDFSFSADAVDVSKGDTVAITFENGGATTHTLTFYSDDAFKNPIASGDTGNVSPGATKTLTLKADVGLYYRCNIHPTQMHGEIEFK